MADRLSNIELLIMLSEDVKAQGDDLTVEINSRGRAHAQRVLENITRLKNELAVQERELQRFGVYLPRQQQEALPRAESLPRVVSKGPAQATG
jgi:hypothetical protein